MRERVEKLDMLIWNLSLSSIKTNRYPLFDNYYLSYHGRGNGMPNMAQI